MTRCHDLTGVADGALNVETFNRLMPSKPAEIVPDC